MDTQYWIKYEKLNLINLNKSDISYCEWELIYSMNYLS